eukprot:UN08317
MEDKLQHRDNLFYFIAIFGLIRHYNTIQNERLFPWANGFSGPVSRGSAGAFFVTVPIISLHTSCGLFPWFNCDNCSSNFFCSAIAFCNFCFAPRRFFRRDDIMLIVDVKSESDVH